LGDVHVLQLIDGLGASGGAERSLAALVPRYVEHGLRLDVAYLFPRTGLLRQIEDEGATVFPLVGGGGIFGWVWRLRRLLSERQPDLVHTTLFNSDIVGRIAGTLSGVPVVSTLANASYGREQLMHPNVRLWKVRSAQALDSATARKVCRFHAVTEHVAEEMSARLNIARNRIEVVPRGRDPDALGMRTLERRSSARDGLGIPPQRRVVLMAARHEYQKGIDLLVQAFPRILGAAPQAVALVAGREGALTPRLRRTISHLWLERHVRLLGTREDVPELMCAADVFVVPSRWEGIAGVLIEAMALEVPIVAADIPPIREVIGGAGRLVRSDDPGALATGVLSMLGDREGAAANAHRARQRFLANYTTDVVAKRMVAFYEKALGRQGRVAV
jgi:glycosyltransferase involved in cell wall biosynthesis